MKAHVNRWWLLPFGVLAASALLALSILVLEPGLSSTPSAEATKRSPSEPVQTSNEADEVGEPVETSEVPTVNEPAKTDEAGVDCAGAFATDYACYQKRYQDLVRGSGVRAAFVGLRNDFARDDFVKTNCHQMAHVIGRTAGEIYGDIPTTYSHGDSFCASGYYHGAMEAIVAKIGPDKILDEADALCAGLDGDQGYSFNHYNCAHGLGHGFMSVRQNDLFKALQACDVLGDRWERNRCYGGVFMENVISQNNPSNPSKYLEADRPLYPCTEVQGRYKEECYQRQTSYALKTQGNDFAKVFDLCSKVESDFRAACYQGLGWDASVQSIVKQGGLGDATINESTGNLCGLGEDHEARSNCVLGAVDYFIRQYYGNVQARAFCGSLSADLSTICFQEADEYYESLRPPSERRGLSS